MKRPPEESADDVPEGWIMKMSSSKKKPYYVHVETNKTQWHHPREDKPKKAPKTNDMDPKLIAEITRAFRVGGSTSNNTSGIKLFQPWPHQVRAVAKVVANISSESGQSSDSNGISSYLIQHSTGSGKSYTIACLAYQLLYTKDCRGCGFHTIVILIDRIKLDEQLGDTVQIFMHQNGIEAFYRAESIEHLSNIVGMPENQKVIITTTHKLGLLVQDKVLLARLTASTSANSSANLGHIAIIADEVHRSHTSNTRESISIILDAFKKNTFYIGFSATPNAHTLQLFGTPKENGKELQPFDCHSITDAVASGQIVDVLENYTSLQCAYELKDAGDNPWLAMDLVCSHESILAAKATSMMQHFVKLKSTQVFGKCLVVARNRKDVVTYHRLLTAFMKKQQLPGRVYCTFSAFDAFNENQFNKCTLNQADIIVVCDKLDTGYNEPSLIAMYLDRPLQSFGRIVQLLCRLNRSRDEKDKAHVVDYANHPLHIRRAFTAFHDEVCIPVSGNDTARLELDYQSSSQILWDLLFFENNEFERVDNNFGHLIVHTFKFFENNEFERVDNKMPEIIAKRLSHQDKDIVTQVRHALDTYMETSSALGIQAKHLPTKWVEKLKTILASEINANNHTACEPTCSCHAIKKNLKVKKIKFITTFQGALWTTTKYQTLKSLLEGSPAEYECVAATPDQVDLKISNLLNSN